MLQSIFMGVQGTILHGNVLDLNQVYILLSYDLELTLSYNLFLIYEIYSVKWIYYE